MTRHLLDTIERAVPDEALPGGMRWTPALPPQPPSPRCDVCDTVLPVRWIVLVDVTDPGNETRDAKPREAPDACPRYIVDDRHWRAR